MKKILQNWCFGKIFAFTSEAHIKKKLTLLKKMSFFTELTTYILLKPIVIFAKIDNKINTFLKKLLNFSKEFIPSVM